VINSPQTNRLRYHFFMARSAFIGAKPRPIIFDYGDLFH
jgi:hypothetical protein